ncbi:MAG: uroporphyrinogen decarboxylase family protein [Chloroflexi bacterium]|nr:uroporphyrinogen decarboxylase family protein [Chloroflexota bacterium]MDA8189859.1 hypothetical protein [Dehalococcoidales bacterium]
MTRTERVMAALRGEPADRVPVGLWGHSYLKEWTHEGLAEAMLDFRRRYDWDFLKVNPRASYHVEDWGAKYEPSGEAHKGPIFADGPIKSARDWNGLWVLDPNKGVLGEHLKALELIRDGLAGDVPFIQTIFSPLGVAKYLVGNSLDVVRSHMRDDPNGVHYGLSVIARTFAEYAARCLDLSADGIFFAQGVCVLSRSTCNGGYSLVWITTIGNEHPGDDGDRAQKRRPRANRWAMQGSASALQLKLQTTLPKEQTKSYTAFGLSLVGSFIWA